MTKSARLTRNDWLRAGFLALVNHGPSALKAEPLARQMKTTKGSFYWHFSDVPEFHQAMFDNWERHAFIDVVAMVETEPSAPLRLRKLGQIAANAANPKNGGAAVEPAIRAWARSDPNAAAAVERVDRQRLDYLETVLGQMGLNNPDFARIVYGALIGMEDMSSRDGGDIVQPLGTLIDLLTALDLA